jgi:hypothetical protein
MNGTIIRITGAVTLAACLVLGGCDDGPTAPAPITTPAAVPNIAGNWHGRYSPCQVRVVCGEGTTAAAAFLQDGSHVSGSVTTQSANFRAATFEGDLTGGGRLSGRITNSGTANTVTGSATTTHVSIHWSVGIFGEASVVLDR